ncbi:HBR199Wp [Eremothecium sinecaudum]|uniref:non-specific serine/threonine protein kinase n=1 Tax=Eremothecium sinecaudum TaxID=45286 RepID=A0A109UX37_9SACH|nr:HBR199Wp [Eremothecium sinecaudum]AMD19100.1 HBR199Wp [Eremothecium sinecaudum]
MPEILSVHNSGNAGHELLNTSSEGSVSSLLKAVNHKSKSRLNLVRFFKGPGNHVNDSNLNVNDKRDALNTLLSPNGDLHHNALFARDNISESSIVLDMTPQQNQHPVIYLQKQIESGVDAAQGPRRSNGSDSSLVKKSQKLKRFLKISSSSDVVNMAQGRHDTDSRRGVSPRAVVTDRNSHQLILYLAQDAQAVIKKYGLPGKMLGEGVSGSVSVIEGDGGLFAVKRFRPRSSRDSLADLSRKVTFEFCTGTILHHENVIETLGLLQDDDMFLVVMEYCPYDLFTLVMSDLMSKEEIWCYFKQLCNGVKYLHSQGLVHRDLKLDNCVVTTQGILKLIDFGSAVIYKATDEDIITMAKGIVGSDPYLAPELLTEIYYDPRPLDVWSIAIMYYCMVVKRFPWKKPREDVSSFKLFCQEPEDESDCSRGPQRISRVLPRQSRELISKMLIIQPEKRISIDAVVKDPWFISIDCCTNKHKGTHVTKEHTHNLVTEDAVKELNEKREQEQALKKEQREPNSSLGINANES